MELLRKMLFKRKGLACLTISISVIAIAVSLWWNSKLSSIINMVNDNLLISNDTIFLAVFFILISSCIAYALGILSSWTCETLSHDLRMGYARYFITKPINEIANINSGEYLSKLQNEIADVSCYLRDNLFQIVDDCIRFTFTLSWMLWLNPKLTILVHLPCVILLWYSVYTSRIIGDIVEESQQANKHMNGYIDTLINLFPILRIFNASSLITSKYALALNKWETLSIKEERTRAKLMSLSGLLTCIPLLLLFLIGGTQIISGQLTLGTLYIFINLSGNVSGVLMNMPGRIALFRRFITNMKRLQPSV